MNRKMLLFIFMIVVVVSITISMDMTFAQEEQDKYNFVHCYDKGTGGTINYPEGTECGNFEDNIDDDKNVNNNKDVNEDEEKAMKEKD